MSMLRLSLLSCAILGLAACGGGQQQAAPAPSEPAAASGGEVAPASNLPETAELKIFNWADYVDPETVTEFEKQTQVKVTVQYFDSNEALEAKVLTGRSGFDLVAPSNAFVGRQIQAGAYQKIDKSLIPNYKNINPALMEMMTQVDPGNEYAVPFFWGTNTLAINTERVRQALGGDTLPDNQWDLVFNPEYTAKLKKCGITYLDSPSEMYPLALNYIKRDPNSNEAADIEAATVLLKNNRTHIKRFSSTDYIDNLARGDTCVAVGFGGDLNIAKRRMAEATGKDLIRVLAPKEGMGIWVDSWMIPADAGNVLNAHRYINWQLEPKVAAQNGNFVTYAPAVTAARELMEAEYGQDPTIFPTDKDLENSFIMAPPKPDTLKLMLRQWQGVKAAK